MRSLLHRLKPVLFFFVVAIDYRHLVFHEARKAARMAGKPLLNAGCGSAYTELSDVNLDIVPREVCNFVRSDIQDLRMFTDKQFGAVYASHVLEHVEDPDAALRELHRVADHVFIITPFLLCPWAWLHPDHKWIFWGSKKICRNPVLANKAAEILYGFIRLVIRGCSFWAANAGKNYREMKNKRQEDTPK